MTTDEVMKAPRYRMRKTYELPVFEGAEMVGFIDPNGRFSYAQFTAAGCTDKARMEEVLATAKGVQRQLKMGRSVVLVEREITTVALASRDPT